MQRIATMIAIAVASLAIVGCGGSGNGDSPTATEDITREARVGATAPATTAAASPPQSETKDDAPAEAARKFAAAYARQDWSAVCDLYSRRALAKIQAGAASTPGVDGETCPEILRSVFGEGMTVEPLDTSGEIAVDGERAALGEVSLVREGGEWKVED